MPKKITQIGMEARKAAAVEAATVVFLRYGYTRATMAELAAAAELSRPTLYELFPGKDDLFAAVIEQLSRRTIRQYRDALPSLETLRTKLHHFCGNWATHGLKLVERHPDAKDLFDLRFPSVRQMYEDFIHFLIEVIQNHDHSASIPVEQVVRNLVFSLRGLKDAAKNVKHMERLVHLQVDIFLTTLIRTEY